MAMGAAQHYTSPSPGAAHWASIKAGLSAGARGRHAHPRGKGKDRDIDRESNTLTITSKQHTF